jgi:hypothetical protein
MFTVLCNKMQCTHRFDEIWALLGQILQPAAEYLTHALRVLGQTLVAQHAIHRTQHPSVTCGVAVLDSVSASAQSCHYK